jgi:hypothetical protein
MDTTTASPCRIHARIGDFVFEGEGPQEVVKDEFELFMGCLCKLPGALPAKANGNGNHAENGQNGKPSVASEEEGLPKDFHDQFDRKNGSDDPAKPIANDLLARAFRVDGKSLSLSVLPRSKDNADAILLLVYGYATVRSQKEVGAYSLTASARQSGVMVARVDRTLSKMPTYIMRGGSGNATRYSITNLGIVKAEKLLAEMYS